MTAKEKVVVILGPTATGKTACGILLAQKLKGEIISVIPCLFSVVWTLLRPNQRPRTGPCRASSELMCANPEEKYSAFDFKREAASLIQEIHGRGHMPSL